MAAALAASTSQTPGGRCRNQASGPRTSRTGAARSI